MNDTIKTCDSMSELYASFGGKMEQDVDFTIHWNEELYREIPIKSLLFRTSYYSVLILCKGRGRYIIDDSVVPDSGQHHLFYESGAYEGI